MIVHRNKSAYFTNFLLGMALFNSGRADEGRAHLLRFIELAPDDPDVEIARGLLSYQQ